MFREHAPLDRPRAAADAGFHCIEMQFPYDLDRDRLAGTIRDLGLAVSVINVPAGDLMTGGEGLAAVPGREAEFRRAVEDAAAYAEALGAINVNVLAGAPRPERSRAACLATLASNLDYAADVLSAAGVRTVVEPINTSDRPGFLLPRVADAADLIGQTGRSDVFVQFDLYHVAMMGDPVVETFEAHRTQVGHIQFADAPGRHEPGTGGIDFAAAFAAIDRAGYNGWTAAEYFPSARTEDGLGWLSGTP